MNASPSSAATQWLFDQEPPARERCVALNHAGGFYRVADLLRENVAGLEGETGFAIVWDYEAAAIFRRSDIRLNFQPFNVQSSTLNVQRSQSVP